MRWKPWGIDVLLQILLSGLICRTISVICNKSSCCQLNCALSAVFFCFLIFPHAMNTENNSAKLLPLDLTPGTKQATKESFVEGEDPRISTSSSPGTQVGPCFYNNSFRATTTF
jgi:hypothetical protein